jgi:hypothetical protein
MPAACIVVRLQEFGFLMRVSRRIMDKAKGMFAYRPISISCYFE